MPDPRRRDLLLTVSNRGPVEHRWQDTGAVESVPGQGGLATALRVAAQLHPTVWLSSPLSPVDRLIAQGKCALPPGASASRFVLTDPAAYDLFYGRFCNEVLWFLQHGLPWPADLDSEAREESWRGYLEVNEAFADAIIDELDSGRIRAVMFHDYHFYTAPRLVRDARPDAYLQHFHHIPWPQPAEWDRLERPIVASICGGLLANDSVVFQTAQSAKNFVLTCQATLPHLRVDIREGTIVGGGRTTRVWSNGISVDPEELREVAATAEFSRFRWLLRPGSGQKTIVRVDRLDITKNVVRGFEAYRLLLRDHPELREKVHFLAVLVPSRSDIDSYREYQDASHAIARQINREFGNHHWTPVKLIFENNRTQGLAAMSLYDVLLVNPVADGMNLVAKEGPLINTHDGVLVLSKRAGAYEGLAPAVIGIEPADVEGTAAALYHALTMPASERHDLAAHLRALVRAHDLRGWFRMLLDDIERNAPLPASSPTSKSTAA